jgi:hypothetical protein
MGSNMRRWIMRGFQRLPVSVRIMSGIGLALPLSSIALLVRFLITLDAGQPYPQSEVGRILAIAMSLTPLGMAFAYQGAIYQARSCSHGTHALSPDTWQGQACSLAVPAALPLCALVLALFVPFSPLGYLIPMALSLAAMAVNLAIFIWATHSAAHHTEQPALRGE